MALLKITGLVGSINAYHARIFPLITETTANNTFPLRESRYRCSVVRALILLITRVDYCSEAMQTVPTLCVNII